MGWGAEETSKLLYSIQGGFLLWWADCFCERFTSIDSPMSMDMHDSIPNIPRWEADQALTDDQTAPSHRELISLIQLIPPFHAEKFT